MPDPESERLRRLREQQLADRDPLVKQHKFQHNSSLKEKRMRKPFSLVKAWKDLPNIVRSPLYGLVFGVLITVLLPFFWDSPYAILAGAAITIIFLIFGVIMGNSLDLRDNIKDNIK